MTKHATEQAHHEATGLDSGPLEVAADVLTRSQAAAAAVVQQVLPALCDGARAMARSLLQNGRVYYVAAGSSGLMAAADAMELGGTFGIPARQIRILMAGGIPSSPEMPGDTEDASDGLRSEMADLTELDTVLTLSASGTTPYTLEALRIATAAGATTIAIANNPGTPLLQQATHAILLETPPEVIAGSTRMGAGTAQKIALNTLSTLMAIELGHVHDGMMVNMKADNTKLRQRAQRMICAIANVSAAEADAALSRSGGALKPAILIAAGAETPKAALSLLESSKGHLRPALQTLTTRTKT